MNQIILLIVCFLAGMLLNRSGKLPHNSHQALNGFIIYISLPALALLYIHNIKFSSSIILPVFMPWIVFLVLAVLMIFIFSKVFKFSKATTGCLMLTAGLGNTSFLGLPLIETYIGKEGLAPSILLDQLGTFLVLSTLGIYAAAHYSSGSTSFKVMLKRVATFPPFIALVIAMLLRPVAYPEWFTFMLERLGSTLTPIALVSVGFQTKFSEWKGKGLPLGFGLGYKLIAAPLLVMILYYFLLRDEKTLFHTVVLESAMAPMITGGIVAMEYDLDPELAVWMLGAGIPVSFVTIRLWHEILSLI